MKQPHTPEIASAVRPVQKSAKLANVCYDIRGPVMARAKQMEEDGHRIIKLNIGNLAPFGYACNSSNELTVASGFDVDPLGPGKLGDRLTADGRVVSQGSRMGVYDIEVTNQNGDRIAVFRGRSYRMKGKQVVT